MTSVDQFPTPESLSALSKDLHPSYRAVLETAAKDATEGKIPDLKDPNVIKAIRQMRTQQTEQMSAKTSAGVKESTRKISMRDGYESELRIWQPEKVPAEGSPLVVLIYGGGFVMGENKQLGPYAKGLAKLFGAVAVCISYRLAPENPFPAAPNDAWDSFKWIAANATSLGADPSKGFIVGGVSAGGNLSHVVAQHSIDEKISPPITGVWLCIPLAFPTKETVPDEYKEFYLSREENKNAALLGKKEMEAFDHHTKMDTNSPWFAAANCKTPFANFPPTYIEVAGCDPLRDDGIIIDKILRSKGIRTKLTVWPGLPHGHFALLGDEQLKRAAARDTMTGFAWLLGKEAPSAEAIDANADVPAAS